MSIFEQEHLRVILLDIRNRVIDVVEIYHGSVNTAQVRVAERASFARSLNPTIQRNTTTWTILYNHPPGDPTPSP